MRLPHYTDIEIELESLIAATGDECKSLIAYLENMPEELRSNHADRIASAIETCIYLNKHGRLHCFRNEEVSRVRLASKHYVSMTRATLDCLVKKKILGFDGRIAEHTCSWMLAYITETSRVDLLRRLVERHQFCFSPMHRCVGYITSSEVLQCLIDYKVSGHKCMRNYDLIEASVLFMANNALFTYMTLHMPGYISAIRDGSLARHAAAHFAKDLPIHGTRIARIYDRLFYHGLIPSAELLQYTAATLFQTNHDEDPEFYASIRESAFTERVKVWKRLLEVYIAHTSSDDETALVAFSEVVDTILSNVSRRAGRRVAVCHGLTSTLRHLCHFKDCASFTDIVLALAGVVAGRVETHATIPLFLHLCTRPPTSAEATRILNAIVTARNPTLRPTVPRKRLLETYRELLHTLFAAGGVLSDEVRQGHVLFSGDVQEMWCNWMVAKCLLAQPLLDKDSLGMVFSYM